MEIKIFDVEHGACALVTADTGAHMLIDCGHNSTTDWRPSTYLPQIGVNIIDRFFITNYDEDHVSDLVNLRAKIAIKLLHRNKSVTPNDIERLKSETGMGNGVAEAVKMANEYTHPVTNPPDLGALTYDVFYNTYPNDFDDENNLSLAVFLHYNNIHIVFPGDLEKAGWEKLLKNEKFQNALSEVNVFVASHHGRESGCCEDVFKYCNPEVAIMSDMATQYDTQKTASWYGDRVSGIPWNGGTRKVLTTRKDGRIKIVATPEGNRITAGNN